MCHLSPGVWESFFSAVYSDSLADGNSGCTPVTHFPEWPLATHEAILEVVYTFFPNKALVSGRIPLKAIRNNLN